MGDLQENGTILLDLQGHGTGSSTSEDSGPKHSVFLSHSGAQKNFAEQLCLDFERSGLSVLFDTRSDSLPTGCRYPALIFKAIRRCQLGVVLLSEEFFCSKWAMLELVGMYRTKRSSNPGIKILPIYFHIRPLECRDMANQERWLSLWNEWAETDKRIKIEEWMEVFQWLGTLNGLVYNRRRFIGEVAFRNVLVETIYRMIPPAPIWDDSHERGGPRLSRAAFDDVREDAALRIGRIETSRTRLQKLLIQVEICPAQCQNLVQTCVRGTEQMMMGYILLSEYDDMWTSYRSMRLRYLTSSLDRLLCTLESIEDLLEACRRQWCRMGLILSGIPLPSPEKKAFTEFDLLLKELDWNLDTINYVLDLSGDLSLNWNEDKDRYVLERNHWTEDFAFAREMIEPIESGTSLVSDDRTHLLMQIKNGSATQSEETFFLLWTICFVLTIWGTDLIFHIRNRSIHKVELGLWAICYVLFIRVVDRLRDSFGRLLVRLISGHMDRHYFAEDVLKSRLEDFGETSKCTSDSGAVPVCFQINHLHLDIGDELGGGEVKAIYRGKWRGQKVAIGVTKRSGYGKREIQEETQKEAALMLRVQHPNVVGFFGYAFTDEAPPPVSGKDNAEPASAGYLVMELMEGDLRREIDGIVRKQLGRPFPDDVTVDILLQIAGAMSHMHDCGVLYRDLKAKNCVVSRRSSSKSGSQILKFYTVKLIDFDISKVLLDQDATNQTLTVGATRWMAPEVWGIGVYVPGASQSQKATYDTSVDVYSFGMTCYEVITGLRPFANCKNNREIQLLLTNEERPPLPHGISCPRSLEKLMSRCWAQESSARPDFKTVQRELWKIKYELELQ